jgi:hypothetical protein
MRFTSVAIRSCNALMPASLGPGTIHNAWPRYKVEWQDLLAQEEAEAVDKQLRAEAMSRVRLAPTTREVSNMEAALIRGNSMDDGVSAK